MLNHFTNAIGDPDLPQRSDTKQVVCVEHHLDLSKRLTVLGLIPAIFLLAQSPGQDEPLGPHSFRIAVCGQEANRKPVESESSLEYLAIMIGRETETSATRRTFLDRGVPLNLARRWRRTKSVLQICLVDHS
jgi:hypothetical protein